MKKIYVGNLPYTADDASLRTEFSSYGEIVNATVIRERETGRSKGFGFVEFGTRESAQAALEKNEKDFHGRPLKVSLARDTRDGKGGSGGGFGGQRPNNNNRFRSGSRDRDMSRDRED